MHKDILTKEQIELLPLIKVFSKNFNLVGGTAIAYHIGHRRSIDFDLFSYKTFKNLEIRKKINVNHNIDREIVNKPGEFTFLSLGVKFTFYQFPYDLQYSENFLNIIKIPDILTLAAMKAFALGGRAKWKDYVDLYFILKDHFSIDQISKKARELFKGEFNAKLFRMQLGYFNDINYAEEVEYLPGFKVSEKIIKKALVEFSLK